MRLKEILKVSDEGSTLNVWHIQVISALESFLENVKTTLQQQLLASSSIVISYCNDTHSESIQKTTELLSYIFTSMGMSTTLAPLVDAGTLNAQLDRAGYGVVLCTPEYAAKVGNGSVVWNVLDNFGEKKKNALHPLLCEGEFKEVALQIVGGHYLIRSVHALLHQDLLVAIPALVDIVFHLSGSQGLGLLPDVLNLKEIVNAKAEMLYRDAFNQLKISIQKHTTDYRLKASLEENIQHHSLISHPERPKTDKEVEGFLRSEAKVGLFFCQNKADTLLTSLHLSGILSKKSERVLTIDCAKYPGQASWDCVRKALKALKLKSADIEAMKQESLVIVLNGYQDLGAYDNLWVKNSLSTWANLKLLVTCQADYFKERGYLRCFLAEVSNRRVEDIAVYSIPTFSSMEAQMAALSIQITPDVNQELEQFPISDKRKAEYVELTRFLERINQIWVDKDYLKSALHQNPKLFISYAWEEDKTEAGKKALARQQMYLSRIAQDFKTVGISTWLDTEQMSGNIDEQMEKSISESHGVLVIETPRYIERSQQVTNVKKEWDAIYAKSQRQAEFRVFPVQYSSDTSQGNQTSSSNEMLLIHGFLANHPNRCDFTHIDEDYVLCMTHPESGLIPRCLCDTEEKKTLYQSVYAVFQRELQLLIGKHLIVDQGQNDVLAFDMNNRLKGYIRPFGLYTEDSSLDTRFDLTKHFETFLNKAECKTAIVLGRAGSGKSLFALSTFKIFLKPWQQYQNANIAQSNSQENQNANDTNIDRPQWLPIYIQLRSYAQRPENALQNALKQQFRFTEADIAALKQGLHHKQKILFILDGYDELGSGVRPNYTEILKGWPHAKLLITSRPEHFDKDHRPLEILALKTSDEKVIYTSVEETYVSPFLSNEIEQYVKQYELANKQSNLNANNSIHDNSNNKVNSNKTYETLQALPGMMVLLDNPFLLTLVLQSLPQLLENRKKFQEKNIARADIYEAFTQTWFLQETKGRELEPETCREFNEELAFRLFAAKTLSISNTSEKKELWEFFNHPDHQASQEASPLSFNAGGFHFIHKSIYEYFVATKLWRVILDLDVVNLWGTRIFAEEKPIIDFLAEIFRNEYSADKEKQLLELITASRNKEFPAIVSCNAINVLNTARVSFSAQDFSGIRVPRVNLNGANFDNANLEGADLTNVSLSGAWLHGTNFNQALMTGVQFGEYPTISFQNQIFSCCYSPGGHILALGMSDGQIHLVDAQTRASIRTLKGHTFTIWSVTFSPDGQRLVSAGSHDKTVRMWDVNTGACLRTFEDQSVFWRAAFDGQRLATNGDSTVKLWQVTNGTLLMTLEGKNTLPAFSPDGQYLATAGGYRNPTIKLWQAETGMLLRTLPYRLPLKDLMKAKRENASTLQLDKGHTEDVSCITFSPVGQRLASGSLDKTTKLWQVDTGILLHTLEGHTSNVTTVAFSPEGKYLASGSYDTTVRLWQVETGACLKIFEGHTAFVRCVAFNREGQRLTSGGDDGTVRLWQVDPDIRIKTESHLAYVTSVAISSDGKYVASGSNDKTVKLWQIENGTLLKTLHHTADVRSIAFSPDGKQLASGSEDNTKLWQVNMGSLLRTLDERYVTSVAFTRDGKQLATGSFEIKLWEVGTGICLKTLIRWTPAFGSDYSTSVAFSPDGQHLVLRTGGKVRLLQINTGTVLKTLKGHYEVKCVALSPDGRHLATGGLWHNTIKLWQLDTGALLKTLKGHSRKVTSIAFSPNGQCLASGSDDHTLRLWDELNGGMPQSFCTQTTSKIKSLCFYPQSEDIFLASGHDDHSVRYWQLIQVKHKPYFQLLWTTDQNALLSQDATFLDVRGLSVNNADLLKQRVTSLFNSWHKETDTPDDAVFTTEIEIQDAVIDSIEQRYGVGGVRSLFFSDNANVASSSSSSRYNEQEKRKEKQKSSDEKYGGNDKDKGKVKQLVLEGRNDNLEKNKKCHIM